MPKIKSNSGAAKRFKTTASGRIRFKKMFARHILTTKSAKRKRNFRRDGLIAPEDEKRVHKLIPYK